MMASEKRTGPGIESEASAKETQRHQFGTELRDQVPSTERHQPKPTHDCPAKKPSQLQTKESRDVHCTSLHWVALHFTAFRNSSAPSMTSKQPCSKSRLAVCCPG